MKRSIYLAALAALALTTACSSDGNDVFDQSAAERLEQYKKEYADVLTADGGLWTMEYFANSDEPGYVFVMKFDKNGSVEISANHKWIGGEFKQETSLWKMIADNGPVLTFNSYNKLFHIFSDPANIEGPDAPTGESGDIDETGYGHEGDYEFQVMEVADEGKTVRLLGKKRLIPIYLHRLDASTDIADYLIRTSEMSSFLSPYFSYATLMDDEGESYTITDLQSGIPSIFPTLGDAVTQTRSGNGIYTLSGFRFMRPLEVPRADGNREPIRLEQFVFKADGSLESRDGCRIVGPRPLDVFVEETVRYKWNVDMDAASGAFARYLSDLVEGVRQAYPTRSLENVYFGYEVYDNKMTPCLNVKIKSAKEAVFYLEYTPGSDSQLSMKVIGCNSQAETFANKTQALRIFAENLTQHAFVLSSADIMAPEVIVICDKNNNDNSMVVKVN